jgi:hypothetical protein
LDGRRKEKYRARLREAKYEEEEINEKVRELNENVKNATKKKRDRDKREYGAVEKRVVG